MTAARQRRRWSLRLGEFAGIEIRVHASMLLLVWLLLVTQEDPETLAGTFGWFGLIFLGVVLHELAHSLVAMRLGVRVREIELLPIGGISKMDRIPDQPAHELAIAIAGPLMSATIGVVVLASALAASMQTWPPDLYYGPIVPRLGWFNLFIAAFNLVPALPLDGGRVLRAILERRVGPYDATRRAAIIGRWLAYGLIAIGAAFNPFLMIIGVFVYVTSRAEEMASIVRHELEGVSVDDVMIRHPMTVTASTTVSELRGILTMTAQRQFPVVDDAGQYLGMVNARDASSAEPLVPLADIVDPVPPVTPRQSIESTTLLTGNDADALAVVDNGVVVGLVRADDVMQLVQRVFSQPSH